MAVPKLTETQSSRLNDIAISINAEWASANSLARQATEKYIAVGLHLLEARSMFPGDKEFGQWANEQVPEIQRRWRTSLMRVARKFAPLFVEDSGQLAADNVLTKLPISTLNELVPASKETLDVVVSRLKKGEGLTKLEAREMAKGPSSVPTGGHGRPEKRLEASGSGGGTGSGHRRLPVPSVPPAEDDSSDSDVVSSIPSLEERMLSLLGLPFLERAKHTDNPWVLFGLNPFVDIPVVSDEVLNIIYRGLIDAHAKENHAFINNVYTELREVVNMEFIDHELDKTMEGMVNGEYD